MRVSTILGTTLAATAAGAVGVVAAQFTRHVALRRQRAQDRQNMLYNASAMHTITYVRGTGDVVSGLQRLCDLLVATDEAKLVYAGRAGLTVPAQQLRTAWDGVLIAQFPNAEAHRSFVSTPEYVAALGAFDKTFSHGLQRGVTRNATTPLVDLLHSLASILPGAGATAPLTVHDVSTDAEKSADPASGPIDLSLAAYQALADDESMDSPALVTVDVYQLDTDEHREAYATYDNTLRRQMSRLPHTILHLGSVLPLAGEPYTDMTDVRVTLFPSTAYYCALMQSDFHSRLAGSLPIVDVQSVATVPITAQVLPRELGGVDPIVDLRDDRPAWAEQPAAGVTDTMEMPSVKPWPRSSRRGQDLMVREAPGSVQG